jgi:hypothetical protein
MDEPVVLGTDPGTLRLPKCAKDGDKLNDCPRMPGAGLTETPFRQVLSEMLALKPYWGKPTVRDFRGGDGNVGIIRSPVRAFVLPDHQHNSLTVCLTRHYNCFCDIIESILRK